MTCKDSQGHEQDTDDWYQFGVLKEVCKGISQNELRLWDRSYMSFLQAFTSETFVYPGKQWWPSLFQISETCDQLFSTKNSYGSNCYDYTYQPSAPIK